MVWGGGGFIGHVVSGERNEVGKVFELRRECATFKELKVSEKKEN